ncbi:MAG TPA: hypothetical protein VN420_05775 [Candidatus Fimivivens sp.]|nr:hypothetical protein [Candidatus Fimivivens sp.]
MNPIARKNLPLYCLAAILTVLTVYGVSYAYSVGGPAGIPRRSTENAFGKFLGVVAFFSLAAMYGRTVLKWIVQSGIFSSTNPSELKSLAKTLLSLLNVTHPYLGLVAVSSTFLHCAFTNSLRDNLFLYLVLILVFLEGLTGMLMKIPGIPPTFFRANLFVHSRFFLGIVLVLLTFVGHLLVKF